MCGSDNRALHPLVREIFVVGPAPRSSCARWSGSSSPWPARRGIMARREVSASPPPPLTIATH
jgi:hypothetical protein